MNRNFPAGLNALLQNDLHARRYFDSLPSYVQRLIHRSRESIQTDAELHRYADNILRGLHS